jgi:hypothetical protein
MSEGLNFNFGGTKPSAGGFEAIPEGTYLARIDKIEVKDTKPKEDVPQKTSDGKPAQYLNPTYKITEGNYEGRLVWGINSIRFPANPLDDTDDERKTREIFLGWLNTVTGTDWADTDQQLNLNNLVGSVVRIVVTQGEWQGKTTNSVKKVLPVGEEDNLDTLRRTI